MSNLFIGIMSGTSMDGVDTALVEIKDHHSQLLGTHFLPYSSSLKMNLLALQHPMENELEAAAKIANQLSELYAESVRQLLEKAGMQAYQIAAIGNHGQTIRHRPDQGFTLQIGNNALLAELSDITVVGDFRSRDVAAGGQGAPLVPAFHQAMFADAKKNRAIINIGGIANITYLAKNQVMMGFDSGPGNMLMDAWTSLHLGKPYDEGGSWAATGVILESLLDDMLAEPYFTLPPPKSTGRDLFNEHWLKQHLPYTQPRSEDVARTLVALTAHSIFYAINKACDKVDEIYLCGGGAHNDLLVKDLKNLFAENITIAKTDVLGVDADWVEAMCFAWLAKQSLEHNPANLPLVTGAKGLRILGAIYPR
jgi:anhydro-N-acetylmuramic acid kinase